MGRRRSSIIAAAATAALAVAVALPGLAGGAGRNTDPAGVNQRILRSGIVTVNGSGESITLSLTVDEGSHLATLRLTNANGVEVKAETVVVQQGKTVSLTYDPPSTVRLRGLILVNGEAGDLDAYYLPMLEVRSGKGSNARAKVVLERFTQVKTG